MSQPEPARALFTDLYQLTMAQAYRRHGRTAHATFSLFIRSYPPGRGHFVAAGLEDVLDYLESFRFEPPDLEYLRSTGQFQDEFVDWLGGLRFTGDVRAMPEGTVFFAGEPVLEVTAPVIEAQLAETYILNQVNVQSILATKAARVVQAARGRPVVDFGARRAHGTDAADKSARVSYIAGFAGTSVVQAGARYGIPTFGTMAHSFITTFEQEIDAFRAYADTFPDATTLLVDTYDTRSGTRAAITVAKEMESRGARLRAIRLDSGDFRELALQARAMLDDAGLGYVEVFASGGLDEYAIEDLLAGGAPIDGFGVGTKTGVSADAPWADSVYKLVAYDGRPVLKLSEGKETLPGPTQVFRVSGKDGSFVRDYVTLPGAAPPEPGAEPLLATVMAQGRRTAPSPELAVARRHCAEELALLPDRFRRLREPDRSYEVRIDPGLAALNKRVAAETRARELGE